MTSGLLLSSRRDIELIRALAQAWRPWWMLKEPIPEFHHQILIELDKFSQALASFSWTFCLGPEESLGNLTQAKLKYPRWLKAQTKSGFVTALFFKTFLFLHYDFWPKDLMMRNSFSVFECWVECIFSVLHLIASRNFKLAFKHLEIMSEKASDFIAGISVV